MFAFSYENLNKLTKTNEGKRYVEEFKTYYKNNYENKPINTLSFAEYQLFFSEGDRKTYETAFFYRRARLTVLQVLSIADDNYIKDLEEIISAICDEYSWIVPAHSYLKLDLFSLETARILSETVYILGDKLSAVLCERVKESIQRKIIQVYETNEFWWDKTHCNWAAVCGCGVGLSYLYLFPERFERVKERLFNTFKSFLSGFDEEGYCFEGVNYWQYGFSSFCVFFDTYEKLTAIRPEFIDDDKVKKVIDYVQNARMSEDIYLPFADGGYPTWQMNANSAYAIKLLYPNQFKFHKISAFLPSHAGLGIRGFYGVTCLDKNCADLESDTSVYYENMQVFIRKREKYSFTAQGGNNGIIHNHNDVGAFQIVKDNKRVICDFGAGLYTKEYFGTDEQRYKIFACNSLSHSVPIVDGKLQSCGEKYCAEILSQDKDSISMDISKAYENGPDSLVVEYSTQKDKIYVNYRCKGLKEKINFHFVSDLQPKIVDDRVEIDGVILTCDLNVLPKIEHRREFPHNPSRAELGVARDVYTLDYQVFSDGEVNVQFVFSL